MAVCHSDDRCEIDTLRAPLDRCVYFSHAGGRLTAVSRDQVNQALVSLENKANNVATVFKKTVCIQVFIGKRLFCNIEAGHQDHQLCPHLNKSLFISVCYDIFLQLAFRAEQRNSLDLFILFTANSCWFVPRRHTRACSVTLSSKTELIGKIEPSFERFEKNTVFFPPFNLSHFPFRIEKKKKIKALF